MAKKHKKNIKIETQSRRLHPNAFKNVENKLEKLRNEEIKSQELQDDQVDNHQADLDNQVNLDNLDNDNDGDDKESIEDQRDNDNLDETEEDETEEIDNEDSNQLNFKEDRKSLLTKEPDTQDESIEESDGLNLDELSDEPSLTNIFKNNETIDKSLQTVEKLKNVAIQIKSSVIFIFQLLINPAFWIILLILVLGAYTISAFMIIGQNDYNIMCDDMGVGSLMLDPNADDFTRQAAIASWLTSTPFEIMDGQPLTREQAIGIMGNLIQESYGANPRAIQNDHSITQWETCNNQCILSWGNVGGKAIGIIQWDTERRQELVKFAISQNTEWHDLNTQLKFLKKEMDSGYEYDQLVSGGFHQTNKTIADYVEIWNQYFERSAESFTGGNNIRITYAEAFANEYVGSGVNVAGRLASFCIGGMSGIDTSNLIQLAIASAWPDKEDSRGSCVGYVDCGQTFAMEAYKEIKLLAEQNSTKDPIRGLLASCDRYVATMYRASGKDINFPWGGANIIGSYLKSSPKWVQVSCQNRQPGDVMWRDGHVMLYLGEVNGRDSIGSASIQSRTGGISGASCSGDLFVGDGDTAIGFRLIGN